MTISISIDNIRKIFFTILLCCFCFITGIPVSLIENISEQSNIVDNKVKAQSVFTATASTLVVGTETATGQANMGSWKATLGSDNNKWTVNRVASVPSLNMQIEVSGVNLYGGNKMIVTIEDTNVTTATAYYHQICDWVDSTGVDNSSDVQCTTGGWRSLNPARATYTNTSDTSRVYEIYNGYFSTRTTSPGTVINTPLTNFLGVNNKVLIRIYSTVSATTQYSIDTLNIETAIDPYYEPSSFTKTAGGTTTNFISDTIGAVSTGVNGSGGSKLVIPMPAASTAVDVYFSFTGLNTQSGVNTILVSPEVCVQNTALTFGVYLRNFTTSAWTQIGTNITGTACSTDTEYALGFNSSTIAGFNVDDYILNGEARVRFFTSAPATVYTIQIDRIYMMLGQVNTDSNLCEISFGTGTATNCSNTRVINEAKTGTPSATWQATAALEYPDNAYALDNDDDATGAEYATSQNLSFPLNIPDNMSVTAIHYAAKYRSNSTAQTADLQLRDYSSTGAGGWVNTVGTDTNALTTYGYYDTWALAETVNDIHRYYDSVNGVMNLRLRTSAGTTTNPGTKDWAFALMSVRWVQEDNRILLRNIFDVSGGALIVGTEVDVDASNLGSWRAARGNDSATNGSGNYWTTARTTSPAGLNKQLYFDGIELYGANKLIVNIEDTNITTGDAYVHQICDWVSATSVDNAADAQCTTGGWRTLNARLANHTSTSDATRSYEIFNGYFSTRTATPGAPINTPLTNFIEPTNSRVLIRVFSTVSSTVQHRVDHASVEVAIDPVYEPSSFSKISPYAGATTGYISDLFGVTADDNNRFVMTNNATNPMNVYFSFNNVKPFNGANTFAFKMNLQVSAVALTFNTSIYNFSTSSWVPINASTITATTSELAYSFVKSNVTVSDFISSGEVRFRINTSVQNTNTMSIDRMYMMLGAINSDDSKCYTTFGTSTTADCANTRSISGGVDAGTAADAVWQTTSVLEYPTDFYPGDNDDDANDSEAAQSSSLEIPITLSQGMSVTAIHFAARFRSNNTTITNALAVKDITGKIGTTGFTNVGATNLATTYSWTDSYLSAELTTSPYQYIDTVNHDIELKLRTSASTDTTAGDLNDWDFVMASIRYLQKNVDSGTLFTDIVDSVGDSVSSPTMSFSVVDTAFSCQTTTATFGVANQKIRISNTTGNPQWTLSLSATGGSVSNWNSGSANYDFNDDGGSPPGCSDGGDADSFAGQMKFDFSGATITPQAGCSASGITFGSNASFVQGSVDSVLLVQASGSAQTNCYWDITGITVTQQIPSSQAMGNYAINMSMTILAN